MGQSTVPHRIHLRARSNQYFVYSGRSVLVTSLEGGVTGKGCEGLYVENTRILSRDELTADGVPLNTITASPVGGAGFLAYAEVPKGPAIPEQSVYVEIARFVGEGMRTVLRVQNYATNERARFELAVRLAADFADIEEADRGRREQTGPVAAAWDARRQEVRFTYGHPQLDRAVAVRLEQAPGPVRYLAEQPEAQPGQDGEQPADGAAARLVFALDLPPHQSAEIQFAVEPIFDGRHGSPPGRGFAGAATPLEQLRRRLREAAPTLTTTNATVARAWQTAIDDLASLPLGLEEGPAAPSAGIPIYQQFFGRDTLTIGLQSLLAMPALLRDALRVNAAYQGTQVDHWRDEEPGKLIHQARWGPLSMLDIDPFRRYYGDYSAPQDFLIGLGQYLAWTDDRATVRALLPAARKVIDWLDRYGDLDGDGFLEYVTRSEKGLKNQGWKDSGDAIVDERGEIIDNPIAASELQAYWYAGLLQAAWAFLICGEWRYALRLLRKAYALRRRFDRAFWMPEAGFYALALGPDKRQVRSLASNAGHLLAMGIVPRDKGQALARRLMRPDFFSGWGIRTLSSEHCAYNPFSYHRGSVWPIESGTFVYGFTRYGCWDESLRLAEGVFAATDLFIGNRLPEVLGGIARDARHPHPGIYPGSNEPQGWSASAIVLTVHSILGMRPFAPLGLLLVDPHLPPWLPDLRLNGVRVGRARVDLQFWRTRKGDTRYRVLHREGRLRVLRQR